MTLEFKRKLEKDTQNRIKYKVFRPDGPEHYNLRIWLEGPDNELNQIEKVEYELHPTFIEPLRTSSNRVEKFSISIWTWGMFDIKATIHYKNTEKEEKLFYLGYDLPDDDGKNYVEA